MGKRYDARKMTELCDSISHAVSNYTVRAEMLENEYSVYNSNNTYRGEAANASKEFVYKGQGKLIKEQVRVLNKLRRKFIETQDAFRDIVDSSPNAKIDMDVLEENKSFFSMQHESFEDKAMQLERLSREIRDRFDRFGYITTISYDRAKYGFEDLCGYSGFMNKCMRSFEEFDEETKSYLKSSELDRYMYDIETDTKATMNALNGMTVYNPDVKKITMTPVAQMAVKMMSSMGITTNSNVSLTEGEKLLKLLRLERSANLPVDANIIKTATEYAVQMCPSKEGTRAIQKCSAAMLATDGQTLKSAADMAVGFIPLAPTVAPELAPILAPLAPIAEGILIGAAIVLFIVILYEVGKAVYHLFESSGKEIEKKADAGAESKGKEGEKGDTKAKEDSEEKDDTPPNELNLDDSKQVGKKWGKHKEDYPEMEDYDDYEEYAQVVHDNPDKIIHDEENGEYIYQKGDDILRVTEDGDFVSLYPGADSARVGKAIDNGGLIWEK